MNTRHILDLLDQARSEVEKIDAATEHPKPLGFAAMVLEVAREEIGNGEEGGNNAGAHVARYKSIELEPDDDNDLGAWCAAFISWVAREAARRMGADLGFRTSQGAKQLGRRIAKAGKQLEVPEPGCVVVWDRGKLQANGKASWLGHIELCERIEYSPSGKPSILHSIGGNVGRYPSKVRRFQHDLSREDRIELFAAFPE